MTVAGEMNFSSRYQVCYGIKSSCTLVTPTLLARLPPSPVLGVVGGALDLRFLLKISAASCSALRFLRPVHGMVSGVQGSDLRGFRRLHLLE